MHALFEKVEFVAYIEKTSSFWNKVLENLEDLRGSRINHLLFRDQGHRSEYRRHDMDGFSNN